MIEPQIDRLLAMKDGWLKGYGKAPKPENLLWFQSAFLAGYDTDLPCPNVLPTIFGSIQLEWNLSTCMIVMGVSFKSKTCYLRCSSLDGACISSTDYDLQNTNAWRSICGIVRKNAAKE